MPLKLSIDVDWNEKVQRMEVACEIEGQIHVERMTEQQWATYVAELDYDDDLPLRIGGWVFEMAGTPEQVAQTINSIKGYIRKVAYTFELTRQTSEILRDEPCKCECHRDGFSLMHIMPCCPITTDKYINKDGSIDMTRYSKALKAHFKTG